MMPNEYNPRLSAEERTKFLESHGFIVGLREPRLNMAYAGKYMVAEMYDESHLPTWDGKQGPWCIVGDNLDDLVAVAYDVWVDGEWPSIQTPSNEG